METVFLTGLGSDIGQYLANRYMDEGYCVYGTHRNALPMKFLERLLTQGGKSFFCDCSDRESIEELIRLVNNDNVRWDIFISAVGTMEPIGPFLNIDFDMWERAIYINAFSQLRIVQGLYPLCKEEPMIAFFAGGGTNNAFTNYSAYCISKILLMKMTELLDDEIPDINVFIAGPGMIGTKIHRETLANKESAGQNYEKTVSFLDTGIMDDDYRLEQIYKFFCWARLQGKLICGGRNFSIVHDEWEKDEHLKKALYKDKNMYKLRRNRNDYHAEGEVI